MLLLCMCVLLLLHVVFAYYISCNHFCFGVLVYLDFVVLRFWLLVCMHVFIAVIALL